ncbi:hypothetical protein BAUCODRAFT_141386 [Baudoinia panamericana UAMH 10762]|uniref:DUF7730 domain-containing protein n=1 Tax=Baudoinia panamericana (strain UAMH 10762) TaxID=717646 RepID=M2MR97_BAUPA|nr:uncharacterized protein BAUCODRAFT_141386 [Baudoinia panamericana UAMH 10762]EMC93978.1 hypothetical protein BAUCODRAFT_141386 [Baudoinia panamericana UAMH 10762]
MARHIVDTEAMATMMKRKRAQVSYLDEDDELDQMLGIDADSQPAYVPHDNDEDLDFGSRKKPTKKANGRSVKTARAKNVKPFPFLSLPAELRDYVYELALTDPNGMTLVSKTKAHRRTVSRGVILADGKTYYARRRRHHRWYQPPVSPQPSTPMPAPVTLVPALLAVCKQIHDEAVGYLYQQNLAIENTYALHSFLATIGSHRIHVTNMRIKAYGNGRGIHKAMNFCALTLLAGCTNLQSLTFDCSIGALRDPKSLARQIFRDGHYFLEANSAAVVDRRAAVDVLRFNDCNFDKDRGMSWYRRHQDLPGKEEFERQFQAELRRLLKC